MIKDSSNLIFVFWKCKNGFLVSNAKIRSELSISVFERKSIFTFWHWKKGVICQECDLPCHIRCAKSADQTCPSPSYRPSDRLPIVGSDTLNLPREQVSLPDSFLERVLNFPFQGLAMRETIFLPKPKGVKKGWIKHVGAISQNRFLVFPISEKRGITDKVFLVSRETEKPVFRTKLWFKFCRHLSSI